MKRRATKEAKPSLAAAAFDTQGAVYVEFILSFIPLFFFFLGMIQIAMLYSAQLVVQQAAITATRAAVVVIDDNPNRYDGQSRLTVETSGGSGGGGGGEEGGLTGLFGSGGGGSLPSLGSDSVSRRYASIRYAAMVPLITITPAPGAVFGGERLSTAIGSEPEARAAMALLYTRYMTSITFPESPGDRDTLLRDWNRPGSDGLSGNITGRVTYVYMCPVPLANRIICEDGVSLFANNSSIALVESFTRMMRDGTLTMAEIDELSAEQQRHEDHFEAWQPMMEEMEAGDGPGFSAAAALTAATILTNGSPARFRPLQAEATLPLQAANYCYHEQEGGSSNCWEQERD